jgi:protein-tyrosine phosphatase
MNPYWIKAKDIRLAIIPRPRGLDWLSDDIRLVQQSGIEVVVSALTTSENGELGLLQEEQECESQGLDFISFPIDDRSVPPSQRDFDAFLGLVLEKMRNGKAIGVHCRAGIGRSSMIVAAALVRNGYSPSSAFQMISESRGCPVPDTAEQRQWVEKWSLT